MFSDFAGKLEEETKVKSYLKIMQVTHFCYKKKGIEAYKIEVTPSLNPWEQPLLTVVYSHVERSIDLYEH